MDEPDRKGGQREQRQQQRRAHILEAARDLFEAEGVAGLVRALWSQAFTPLFVELEAAEAAETLPPARLRRVAHAFVDYWLRFPDRYKVVFLIQDRREGEADRWFIEETDVVPELLRFVRLIAAAQDDPDGDHTREAEALICALIGVTHMLVGIPEYRWAGSETYIDLILRAFVRD
jgi:AcrR family transcriptional regulator